MAVGRGIHAGIASTTLDAMFRLGEFSDDMVNPKEPLVLLLTMTDSTFMGVVAGLFDVFGEDGYLDVVDFLSLFEVRPSPRGAVPRAPRASFPAHPAPG